ncbi:MAG TPA: large conductance mechanosensitive channel protein MscL [Blastocatellia bacterium]|nr:large conductance mechanosensitive channel protein MscL [Blastocatellia bacterium]
MWREFKEFINRGNVMDLAVGVIMGAAFGKIVSSAVSDLIGPILGKVLGDTGLAGQVLHLGSKQLPDGKIENLDFKYGSFIQNVIDFLIVALVIFVIVKIYNRFRKSAPPPPPTPTETLLTEIRDLLKRS